MVSGLGRGSIFVAMCAPRFYIRPNTNRMSTTSTIVPSMPPRYMCFPPQSRCVQRPGMGCVRQGVMSLWLTTPDEHKSADRFEGEPSCVVLGYSAASFTLCPASFIFFPAWCAVSLIVPAALLVAGFNVPAALSMPFFTLSVVEPMMGSPVGGCDVSGPVLRISPVSGFRVSKPPGAFRAKQRPDALHTPTLHLSASHALRSACGCRPLVHQKCTAGVPRRL
jgi:hypothetical protein